MARLKPWYQVVTPREDLRTGKPLDASEFAVHLDHVREGRAPVDYQSPERFFERTYLTVTLRDLASQVVRRLSGQKVETSAVFNMATQFGGGKTHALTLLYHLANGGPRANAWRGVSTILTGSGIREVPKADVAVFVGTEFDSLSGRGGDDGTPNRKTPWGEIAWQLGREKAFEVVSRHDEQGTAPAGDVIRRFLPDGPVLILMDELMNYISRNRRSGLAAQLYNFLQNLGEEARARDNMVLAVSIPASELEMNSDDQRDHESVKKLLDRLGKAVVMSAETETSEIIRRRLFEWSSLPEEGTRTAAEHADWAIEHQQQVAAGDVDSIREQFRSSYPFHPAVLSVFERKWQSLPRFQKTRGVLRLLALWVSNAYEQGFRGGYRDSLITLGTAPLDDPYFRAALFEQLGTDQLEGPVTTDIAGRPDAHAIRLDREASEGIGKSRLHQKAATTILFESNGGMTRSEATTPEIRYAVGEPDLDLANVETVLEALVDRSYYLTESHSRYCYSVHPNLNKVLTDRKASIQQPAVDERVREEIQAVFKSGSASVSRIYFAEKSGQVPDRAALTLVVLAPSQAYSDPSTLRQIETLLREHGTSGRTFKSALLFAVPDASAGLASEARNVLAWEDIAGDPETVERLDDAQKQQLKTGQAKAVRDLKEAVWRTYKYVVLLGKDNTLKEIDLGLVHSSAASSIAELIVNRLRSDDEITESVGPRMLVRYWPPAITAWSTKSVRDAFYSSPSLPRLMNPDAIRRTIVDGVAGKLFGYVGKAGDAYDPTYYGTPIAESDVEISDEMFLLAKDEVERDLERRRKEEEEEERRRKGLVTIVVKKDRKLSRLAISPPTATLQANGQISFSVTGYDQDDHPMDPVGMQWSASVGSIDASGRYTAPPASATCSVTARAGEVSATAQIEVQDAAAEMGLRWQGFVPPTKWTNFYMKVITRFARLPGVKIKVQLDVPPSPAVTESSIEATRTALRELGLSEDLE